MFPSLLHGSREPNPSPQATEGKGLVETTGAGFYYASSKGGRRSQEGIKVPGQRLTVGVGSSRGRGCCNHLEHGGDKAMKGVR